MNVTEDQVKQLIKTLANTFGHPIRSPILRTPDEYGLEYKNVSFPSMDGVPLEAWFMPADSAGMAITTSPSTRSRCSSGSTRTCGDKRQVKAGTRTQIQSAGFFGHTCLLNTSWRNTWLLGILHLCRLKTLD
jgi:hypothetical protein